jgi:Mg-chelatase subunit ChlD
VVDANNHPQYSFELLNSLGRLGVEGSTNSYTVISGGNISNLDLDFGGYLVDSMTAVDGSNATTTVNTNNNWIGVGGNWFEAGDTLFMSFLDVSGNAGQVRGMDMLVEGQGGAPYTLDWTVTAAIDYSGNTITYSGSVSGTGNADMPFSIPLSGGALYFTNLQISDPAGSGDFRIAFSGISANDYFSDIPLALDYTLTDADGDTASGLIDVTLMSGNVAPVIGTPTASASVSEEGLIAGLADVTGSPADTTNATVITGSLSIYDPDGSAPTVSLSWPGTPPALTSGGVAVSWTGAGTNTLVGSAGGAEVVRIAITDNGNYTVTLSKAIDHATANAEDVLGFDVQVSATDGVATTTGTLTVNIEDDSTAVGNLTQAVTVPQQDTNLMIILDVSGSMDQSSGIAGQSRLQAAQAAINQLIDRYDGLGDVAVRVVYFSDGANWSGSVWVDAATGKIQIANLTAGGATNYDAALADAMTAFDHSGKIAGAQNVSYFLSDGAPTYSNNNVNTLSDTNRTGSNNSDEGIQANEETLWTTFLNNNEVKSYALGIGTGLPANAQTLLNPIAYDGTGAGTNTNSIVVTDMSQLSAALQATVPPATTGNLLTGNVAFGSGVGADGGYMPAITLDGTTYTFDSATGTIAVSGSGSAGYSYDGTSHELTIATTKGGSLMVDMDNGSYTYTPSGTMAGTVTETIGFSLTDTDGDTSSGVLTLNVSREGSTMTGTSGADALSGTTGADILIGGAGNDTLAGLVGGDTFKWSLADRGTTASPASDTVADFDTVINSDKLDLRDLLQGESHAGTDAGNLADYLHFSYDSSTSTTVLEVKSQGTSMSGPDQIINLAGVDLVTGYTSDQQIIQDLLTKGKLITD